MKKSYSKDRTISYDPYITDKRPLVRKFCSEHSTRGEGYYEDEDENYDVVT